jgi:hypothetical protein
VAAEVVVDAETISQLKDIYGRENLRRGEPMMDLKELPRARRQTRRHGRAGSAGTLRELGEAYLGTLDSARELSVKIEQQVVAAQAGGSSLEEVSDASGLSVSQIEYILASVDFQRRLAAN